VDIVSGCRDIAVLFFAAEMRDFHFHVTGQSRENSNKSDDCRSRGHAWHSFSKIHLHYGIHTDSRREQQLYHQQHRW
jgi:hypothetical protein